MKQPTAIYTHVDTRGLARAIVDSSLGPAVMADDRAMRLSAPRTRQGEEFRLPHGGDAACAA